MNEREIQHALARGVRHDHVIVAPNIYLYLWESDLLSVTRAHLVHEYEIKVSRTDFIADRKKTDRHRILTTGKREARPWERESEYVASRPNYFWYVAPEGLLSPMTDIPEHAGLMEVRAFQQWDKTLRLGTIVVKNAPRLHREKISDKQFIEIGRKMAFRYWRAMLDENKQPEETQEESPSYNDTLEL